MWLIPTIVLAGLAVACGQTRAAAQAPYPNSLVPKEVQQNVIQWTKKGPLFRTPEFQHIEEWHVHRVLQVRREAPLEAYLVVEFDDRDGRPSGNMAVRREDGSLITAAPASLDDRRPLDLSDAKARVEAKLQTTSLDEYYFYKANVGEPGGPITRPLAVVQTAVGRVYFNSRGNALAEHGTTLARDYGIPRDPRDRGAPPGVIDLQPLTW
jgi:hypothetical protein